MGILDFIFFLFGSGASIRMFAASPYTIVIGAMLVFTAALARSWNRKDLIAQPIWLIIPYLASAVSAAIFTAMFCIWWIGSFSQLPQNFLRHFPMMLGLFWLTAPLAWLYGIPFERFHQPTVAVKTRLWALLIVSAWRVLITIAIICTLFSVPVGRATFFVLFFGNLVALTAIVISTPRSKPEAVPQVVTMMGAITPRGVESRNTIRRVFGCLSVFMIIFALIGLAYFVDTAHSNQPESVQLNLADIERAPTAELWIAVGGSVLFWLLLLPLAQKKVQMQARIRDLIDSDQIEVATQVLIQKKQTDFPAGWALPFESTLEGSQPMQLFRFLNTAVTNSPADSWVMILIRKPWQDFVSDPLLYWYEDEHCASMAELLKLESFDPDLASPAAAKTLERLDDLKNVNEFFREIQEHQFGKDDNVSETEKTEATKEHQPSTNSDLELAESQRLFKFWPELDSSRQTIKEWLLQLAGEAYQPPEQHESEGDENR